MFGLLSRDSIIPVSFEKDTMARTVKDTAIILGTAIVKIPFEKTPDHTKSSTSTDLSGLRLGIPRNEISDVSYPAKDSFERAVEAVRKNGAESLMSSFRTSVNITA